MSRGNMTTRRRFLGRASAAVSGVSILPSRLVFSSEVNSRVNVGVVGIGGRGRRDARNLLETGQVQVVALADYFDFQMSESADSLGVDGSRCFAGLEGYRQLMDLPDVDAVLLTAPPCFRPAHFREAIRKGKHVFAEKPIGVDAWGCRDFLETGKSAARSQLTVGAGLQTRYESGRGRIVSMLREGAIGKMIMAHSTRMGGDLWRRPRPAHFSERDHQIRHWLYYLWASGDFIVEMHVHNLDVINWFTGMLPVKAYGTGGRAVRLDVGDIYDHLDVVYEYPGGFHLTHTGSQISTGAFGQTSRIIGSEGSYDSREGLVTRDNLTLKHADTSQASARQMQQFVASITGQGPYMNDSEYVATSSFTAILGRTAAYRKQAVTWEEVWQENARIEMPV